MSGKCCGGNGGGAFGSASELDDEVGSGGGAKEAARAMMACWIFSAGTWTFSPDFKGRSGMVKTSAVM